MFLMFLILHFFYLGEMCIVSQCGKLVTDLIVMITTRQACPDFSAIETVKQFKKKGLFHQSFFL